MSDAPKAYTEEYRVSRKPHKCCECGGTIFYKERYHLFKGIWEDHWETFKTCAVCAEMRGDINSDLRYDERICFEELCEYIFEGGWKPDMKKFIDNCDNRGKLVPSWMRQMLKEPDKFRHKKRKGN